MPAIVPWWRSTPLTWARPAVAARIPASTSIVNVVVERVRARGVAMPGTSSGSRTTYSGEALLGAGLGDVEARTRRRGRTRAASGDLLLGFGGSVGTSSRQRTQPARARCMTRCSPEALMSRNLPCRVTSSTKRALERAAAAGRRS